MKKSTANKLLAVNGRIYKGVYAAAVVFHLLMLGAILVAALLPFRNGNNYFAYTNGFFGESLAWLHPYVLLCMPVGACVCCFFARRQPAFWMPTAGLMTAFS